MKYPIPLRSTPVVLGALLSITTVVMVILAYSPGTKSDSEPILEQENFEQLLPISSNTEPAETLSSTSTIPETQELVTTAPAKPTIPTSVTDAPTAKKMAEPETKINQPKVTPTPPPPTSTTPSVSAEKMLRAHNSVRSAHGVSPLTWSASLAKSAQTWSDQLKTESCKMRHDYDSSYGENIFWKSLSGGDTNTQISSDADAVAWWAAEEKYYSYETNECKPGSVCGHYTQLVWAETTEVGCGVSSCLSGSTRSDIWVCRYNPPGNVIGESPY